VVAGNPIDDTNAQNNNKIDGINDRVHGPRQLHDPRGLSLPQPSQIPTCMFLEQEDDNNWWQMHKQLSADTINFGQSAEGNWHEFTCVPVTRTNILLEFMSRWLGMLQRSRTRMAIQSPRQPRNKQLIWILGRSDNAWINIINSRLERGDYALSMTNSTIAEGWMQKSNFVEPNGNPIQATTCVDAARHYNQLFINAEIKGYSQWFAGKKNNVLDALSWNWHRDDKKLTSVLHFHFLLQMLE
jgi:hypothetical protein